MTTILNGLIGGLVVGVLAGVVSRRLSGAGPPVIDPKGFIGRRFPSSVPSWLFVWPWYGCLAGATLIGLELAVLGLLGVPPSLVEALTVTVVWSALLLGSFVTFLSVVEDREDLPIRELIVFHALYGLGLGAWIRMTWIT